MKHEGADLHQSPLLRQRPNDPLGLVLRQPEFGAGRARVGRREPGRSEARFHPSPCPCIAGDVLRLMADERHALGAPRHATGRQPGQDEAEQIGRRPNRDASAERFPGDARLARMIAVEAGDLGLHSFAQIQDD